MSTTNNGGQVFTFDYKQEGTSQGFNRLFHKVLPTGIISGGKLTRVTDTNVSIAPMLMMFEDTSTKVSVRVETTTDASVGVSTSAPYIIAKFKWLNVEENYVEFVASQYADITSADIIIGKCLYKSSVLSGFDYSRKTWSQDHYFGIEKTHPDFRVTANEPEDLNIKVDKGEAIIGGKKVSFNGGTHLVNNSVTTSRIDLVSIDSNGELHVIEGTQNESPVAPPFPNNMLTVAMITLGSNPEVITGDMIENVFVNNFVQPNSLTKVPTQINKSTTVNTIYEDAKYVLSGSNTTLTLGSGLYAGCEIQVIMAEKGSIKYKGIEGSGTLTDTVLGHRNLKYTFDGSSWYCSSAPEIGAKYEQYPDDEIPSLIYGGQWVSKKYGGVFPRLEGGDAKPFTKSFKATNSATTVTFSGTKPTTSQLAVGDILIYDNEYRTVSALQTSGSTVNSCTIDKQFTNYSKITNIIVGQNESLPNIRGSIKSAESHNGLLWKSIGILGGVFKNTEIDTKINVSTDHGTTNFNATPNIDFDASLSNPTYKDKAKVTTLNFTSKLWFREF